MAEIEWKGAAWRGAYGNLSVRELLTVLKGFGPMEVLEFEKPGCCRGQLSLCLDNKGTKEITLYYLQILHEHRRGHGRTILQWLKKIFKGDVYVEDPGVIRVRNASEDNLLFWVKMFREGLVDAVEGETCTLCPWMSSEEIDRLEEEIRRSCPDSETASKA